MPDRFIFNDQSQTNSYGFSVMTAGIDLTRFLKNPVMLNGHWNDTNNVIGKWLDIKKEDGILSGVPEFDTEDEQGKNIAGKVERGYVKSCSMGILFDRKDMKLVGEKIILEKCELMEVSIVAVPSNQNAIRLYAKDTGKLLSDSEVKELALSLQNSTTPETENKEDMNIKLLKGAMTALGFDANAEVDATELSAKIMELSTQKAEAERKLAEIKEKQEREQLAHINQMVDKAVKEGKITADKKDDFVNLGIANYELLKSTLDNLPAKKDLAGSISSKTNAEIKTVDDFQKLSLEEQLSFKQTNPEGYKKLFTNHQK